MIKIQDHLIALAPKQRSQLAFLLQHLQGAMAAGRSPGELADAFGSVLVSQGSKNKNDPKEMLEKLLSLDVTFVRDLLDASKVKCIVGSHVYIFNLRIPAKKRRTALCLDPLELRDLKHSQRWSKSAKTSCSRTVISSSSLTVLKTNFFLFWSTVSIHRFPSLSLYILKCSL